MVESKFVIPVILLNHLDLFFAYSILESSFLKKDVIWSEYKVMTFKTSFGRLIHLMHKLSSHETSENSAKQTTDWYIWPRMGNKTGIIAHVENAEKTGACNLSGRKLEEVSQNR